MKTLICTSAVVALIVLACHSCATPTWETLHPEVIATSPELDPESGYTQADLDACKVIVESNQESCDPDNQ